MAEITVPFSPGWVHKKDSSTFTDAFSDIVNFYLFGTPCDSVSSSGRSMSDLGWKKDIWKAHDLREFLLSEAGLQTNVTYKKATKLDKMSETITAAGLSGNFHTRRTLNRVAFYSDGSRVDILTILYYIRCALAHGRFESYNYDGQMVYVLEAIKKKPSTNEYFVRARMILSEATLLKWKDILTKGPQPFEEQKKRFQESVQDKIVQTIRENPIRKKNDLTTFLNYEENVIYNQLKELTEKGRTVYDPSKRIWRIQQ